MKILRKFERIPPDNTKLPATMKSFFFSKVLPALLIASCLIVAGCKKDKKEEEVPDNTVWDVDNQPLPKFIEFFPIEMDKISRISKFRSSIGHDYSDYTEHCRSMKHYFEPKGTVDWQQVKLFSPVDGKITRVDNEWAGVKIEIECKNYPAFRISIFHINPDKGFSVGEQIGKGQFLGYHSGNMTYSDISCIANDPTKQGRMVSFFHLIKDELFNVLKARGINTREELIISKEERDAHPLTCNGDQFVPGDSLPGWVVLN
jgi:hypothetical protein